LRLAIVNTKFCAHLRPKTRTVSDIIRKFQYQ